MNLLGGRVSAATIFAKPTFGCQFISGSQCPYDLPVFTGGFSGFPYATWGERVRINPTDKIYIQAGAFSVDPNRENLHGFDFGLKTATGIVTPVEIGYDTDSATIATRATTSSAPGSTTRPSPIRCSTRSASPARWPAARR